MNQITEAHIFLRRAIETNQTLINKGVNEYGESGTVKVRFYHNGDCMHAFRAYSCFINFPRCDPRTGQTLPTCRSACENFFISCKYSKDLWRCGKSKYFNGYAPESPSGFDGNGTPMYYRDYFPGQPFRANKFDKSKNPVAVCTPSILGAAARSTGHSSGMGLFFVSVVGVTTILMSQMLLW